VAGSLPGSQIASPWPPPQHPYIMSCKGRQKGLRTPPPPRMDKLRVRAARYMSIEENAEAQRRAMKEATSAASSNMKRNRSGKFESASREIILRLSIRAFDYIMVIRLQPDSG